MRISQLRFLVLLDHYKTISRVAKEAMVAQPSISQSIKELEEELGFEILLRNKRNKHVEGFTRLGRIVLKKAEIILRELDEISMLKESDGSEIVGRLTIGTAPFFSSGIVFDTISVLRDRYPGIRVEMYQASSGQLLKMMTMREIDVALCMVNDNYKIFDSEFQKNNFYFDELFVDPMVLVVRSVHPLAERQHVTLAEMNNYQCITFNREFVDNTAQLLRQYGYSNHIKTFNDWDIIRKVLATSDDFFLVPEFCVKEKFEVHGGFCQLMVDGVEWNCRIGIVERNDYLTELEQIFIGALKAQVLAVQ
ncbi:MAG: LysR family transcriptional regulator [Peptococcaceae bacterium]|nr:LysR family transcriptional regulator [Peptococcaceae bacterium]